MDDYDSPWKEGMELYFKELMQFFFPDIAAGIAWNKGYQFLDKKLQQVVRDAEIGRRHADKLVRVWSLENEPFHVMIHIEVQSDKDRDFPLRMYIYNYRNRFKKVGHYSSYCRCVKSEKTSNKKKKGENNKKNGNKFLSWAYVEAANFAKRYSREAQRFYQKKEAKRNRIVAVKALSNKLCRASYYIMRDQIVVYTERGMNIRIISCRKASNSERKFYEKEGRTR
jgi:uncharacterized DUF497 family protein